jgi:hypothetical protein
MFGPMHIPSWKKDPRHILFVAARYKFVAKMLGGNCGRGKVLEVGCGDATFTPIVEQATHCIVDLMDVVPQVEARKVILHDMVNGPYEVWDAIYSLDVLEHIAPMNEDRFLRHIKASLYPNGVFICGSPSWESQSYASPESAAYHTNCKKQEDFRRALHMHWDNVFVFGMNDEVVHTGYGPMCHYRLAICT